MFLVGCAVLEGTLFPAPTEALFLALALARPRGVGWLVAPAVAGSVGGGTLGYMLGAAFFDSLGHRLLQMSGGAAQLDSLSTLYRDHLFITLVTSGYTPIPYLAYTVGAGVLAVPLTPFLAYSLIGRGVKYVVLSIVALGLAGSIRAMPSAGAWRFMVALIMLFLLAIWGLPL